MFPVTGCGSGWGAGRAVTHMPAQQVTPWLWGPGVKPQVPTAMEHGATIETQLKHRAWQHGWHVHKSHEAAVLPAAKQLGPNLHCAFGQLLSFSSFSLFK